MTVRYLRIVLRILLVLLWAPTLALAASVVTLQVTLEGVTLPVLSIVIALSTLSGATALLLRIDAELKSNAGVSLPRPLLFASAHMCGSWMAGALAFVICEGQDANDWIELAVIIVGAFSGAKFIEFVAEKVLNGPKEKLP